MSRRHPCCDGAWCGCKVQRADEDSEPVWFRLGPHQTAVAAIWDYWERPAATEKNGDEPN